MSLFSYSTEAWELFCFQDLSLTAHYSSVETANDFIEPVMTTQSPAPSAFYGNFTLQFARFTPTRLHWGRPTCIFTKEGCGASRALSEFCWAAAALSAARSLPGAFLSATGLSGAPSSASASSLSAVLRGQSSVSSGCLSPACPCTGTQHAVRFCTASPWEAWQPSSRRVCTQIFHFLAAFPNVSALPFLFLCQWRKVFFLPVLPSKRYCL